MNKSFLLFVFILLGVAIGGWIQNDSELKYYSEDILCRYKTPISCGINKTLLCNGESKDDRTFQIINGCGCNPDSFSILYGSKLYLDSRCNAMEFRMSGYEMLLLGMRIDINNASKSDLISIDGIGESIAERIIEYRSEVGRIEHIEQLKEIKGIGKKMVQRFERYLCVNCLP